MDDISFVIDGKPIPQARPRITKFGSYDPQAKQKKAIRKKLVQEEYKPLKGALKSDIKFYIPIPKSTTKKARKLIESSEVHPIKKTCDIDNLIKFVFDTINGIIFEDDSQIIEVIAIKEYSDSPRTEIRISKA